MKKTFVYLLILSASGAISGYINGLLGTGGGILLVFILSALMTEEKGFNPRDIFATVIAAILPMSIVSVYFYFKGGNVNFFDAEPYLLPGIIGGICGGILLEHINLKFLKKLFSFMVLYAGIRMIIS